MKLPRDLAGEELARKLTQFGYEVTRQTGSHLRLTSVFRGHEHNITIPAHRFLKVGTLSQILSDVSQYLEIEKNQLTSILFEG